MTKKQKRFVEEYLIDLNATQAAIRAGYSPDTAKEIGCENLTKPNIKAAVDKVLAERSRRTGVTADRVILELARIAFCNACDVIDRETGQVLSDASRDDLAAVQSIRVKSGEAFNEYEVKLADKLKALDMLGRHLGMFKEKLELSGALEVEKDKLSELLEQMNE
ncbi:MAG: terminase small subunit [Ruminococcus sp.]|nr:terminase small subunit [Ruminococcus sp.]